MTIRKIVTGLLLTLAASAGQAQIHYRIEGNIGQPNVTDTLQLVENRGSEREGVIYQSVIDTLYIVNGEIVPAEGTLAEPLTANASNKNLSLQLIHIALTDGTTRINGTIGGPVVRQSGNPIADGMTKMEEDFQALAREIGQMMRSGVPLDTLALIAREDSFVVSVLRAHPNDPVAVVALLDYADDVCTLQPQRGLELLAMADASLIANEPKLRQKQKALQTLLATGEGSMFCDFMVEYDGKEQRLSDYVGRGQYVLVDFWARWCGPCREEIPNIVAAYEKYKGVGLQVVGVACMEAPERTLAYVREQHIPYPQILNAGPSVLQLYGINGIPHLILFAPDGTILDRGLRGGDIEQRLQKIFK